VFEIAPEASWRRLPRPSMRLQIDTALWVIHAFQKKSRTGITTPKHEIDLIHDRLKRLKEALR